MHTQHIESKAESNIEHKSNEVIAANKKKENEQAKEENPVQNHSFKIPKIFKEADTLISLAITIAAGVTAPYNPTASVVLSQILSIGGNLFYHRKINSVKAQIKIKTELRDKQREHLAKKVNDLGKEVKKAIEYNQFGGENFKKVIVGTLFLGQVATSTMMLINKQKNANNAEANIIAIASFALSLAAHYIQKYALHNWKEYDEQLRQELEELKELQNKLVEDEHKDQIETANLEKEFMINEVDNQEDVIKAIKDDNKSLRFSVIRLKRDKNDLIEKNNKLELKIKQLEKIEEPVELESKIPGQVIKNTGATIQESVVASEKNISSGFSYLPSFNLGRFNLLRFFVTPPAPLTAETAPVPLAGKYLSNV